MLPEDKKEGANTTFAYLDETHDYDEAQGQKLASGEDILDTCGPAHAVAVHPCQQHWKGRKKEELEREMWRT